MTLRKTFFIEPFVDAGPGNLAHQTGAVIGADGIRSMSMIPVLKRRGRRNVIQTEGGINKWRMHRFEVTQENPSYVSL